MTATILVTALVGLLAALATIISVVLGFTLRGQNTKIRKLDKDLMSKQSKEMCVLEHNHVRESLTRIEMCVLATGKGQNALLRKITRLEALIAIKEDGSDDD